MFIGSYVASFAASAAAWCACQTCQVASREALTHSARVAWSSLFFLAIVTAWLLRDFAKPMLERIPCAMGGLRKGIKGCWNWEHRVIAAVSTWFAI
jgi:hypothetical protein